MYKIFSQKKKKKMYKIYYIEYNFLKLLLVISSAAYSVKI